MSRVYKLKGQSAAPRVPEVEIDFAAELNPEQLAAVTAPPGQSLVIAGAGSGKTRTLTYRVAYLLKNAVAPENILLLTFTNKAAREMLERVEDLLPQQTAGLWSGTFHSICNRILRRHAESAGLTRSFTILDSDDQKALLTKVIKEGNIARQVEADTGEKFPKAPVILGLISLAANTRRPLKEIIGKEFSPDPEFVAGITKTAHLYDEKKRKANSVDFDDLLIRTLDLFRSNPQVLSQYQYQFQFILVDEYQDTNRLQSELIEALAGQHGNVMVVGDDAQSIYSWRGADFKNIIEFPQRHAGAQVFRIETNYRSLPGILALANEAIRPNVKQFPKNLKASRPDSGQKPVTVPLQTPQEQAAFVAQRMRELHEEEGIPWNEMAVLYRAHFQSMEVQLQLTSEGLPFQVTSGLKFFELAHIKDFSAFLKFAVNPRDEAAFDRIVQLLPGVGAAGAAKIWTAWLNAEPARTGLPPKSYSAVFSKIKVSAKADKDWQQLGWTLDEIVDEEGKLRDPMAVMTSIFEGVYERYMRVTFDNFESRRQDLEQFMRFGGRFTGVEEMLSELSLLSGPEAAESAVPAADQGQESITLSSVHQAKGLEWRVVFVIWLTDAMFPNLRAVESGGEGGMEEERRLFYVAVTRARDQLYLTWPRLWPKAYTGDTWQMPSRFLETLPRWSVEEWRIGR
ncbi:MAG: ATP-dependent helicase [Verrucomicrobiaceae bacterium]|nr:MAG: ATP-dependent helicase [Verrucomicrobiaceae bacterium]